MLPYFCLDCQKELIKNLRYLWPVVYFTLNQLEHQGLVFQSSLSLFPTCKRSGEYSPHLLKRNCEQVGLIKHFLMLCHFKHRHVIIKTERVAIFFVWITNKYMIKILKYLWPVANFTFNQLGHQGLAFQLDLSPNSTLKEYVQHSPPSPE